MSQPKFTFIVPPFSAFASGGNVYNERFTDALQTAGIEVEKIDFQELAKTVPSPSESIATFDSLFLDKLNASPDALSAFSKKYLLVHFLPSMFPPDEEKFEGQEPFLLEQFDGLVVTSEFSKNYFLEKGLQKPILVVPPACEIEIFEPSEASGSFSSFHPVASEPLCHSRREPLSLVGLSSPDSEVPCGNDKAARRQQGGKAGSLQSLNCLMVANLVATKGVFEFFETLANAKWRGSDRLKITLAGSDNIEPDYAEHCKQLWNSYLWLKKITRYAGILPHRELSKLYRTADLFISTSFFETYGMALQEARHFSLPILAIRGGNVAFHVQENQNGRLFSDPENLVAFLGELVENEQLLKKFQLAARQLKPVENYSWQDAAGIFIRHFQLETCQHFKC